MPQLLLFLNRGALVSTFHGDISRFKTSLIKNWYLRRFAIIKSCSVRNDNNILICYFKLYLFGIPLCLNMIPNWRMLYKLNGVGKQANNFRTIEMDTKTKYSLFYWYISCFCIICNRIANVVKFLLVEGRVCSLCTSQN